jgi:hypothetical protein
MPALLPGLPVNMPAQVTLPQDLPALAGQAPAAPAPGVPAAPAAAAPSPAGPVAPLLAALP